MCWLNRTAIAHIAEEDIEIFKMCEDSTEKNTVQSYFMASNYILNKVYKLESPIEIEQFSTYYGINKGFHSYDKTCIVKRCIDGIIIMSEYSTIETYCDYAIIVKGYIPKGATYYINDRDEYVSDEICLTKIETIQTVFHIRFASTLLP